jgi:hypothetical protein
MVVGFTRTSMILLFLYLCLYNCCFYIRIFRLLATYMTGVLSFASIWDRMANLSCLCYYFVLCFVPSVVCVWITHSATSVFSNVYSDLHSPCSIIIKVKAQVTIQYWHKGNNYYSTYWHYVPIFIHSCCPWFCYFYTCACTIVAFISGFSGCLPLTWRVSCHSRASGTVWLILVV